MYDWFKIFNLNEFEALGLVSKEYVLNLAGIGQKSILVTQGEEISMQFDGVFISMNMNQKNPFYFENLAIQLKDGDMFLGVSVD
jgi:hypothetical protein